MKKKITLVFFTIILFNLSCKDNKKTSYEKKAIIKEISFDKILKCSDFVYIENYFATTDYGCVYNPKNVNDLGNIIIYLIPKLAVNNSIDLELEINNFSIEDLKRDFNIYLYFINKDFLNFNPNGDPIYYQKEKFTEELYFYNDKNNSWDFLDEININNSSENIKEQNWRDDFIDSKTNLVKKTKSKFDLSSIENEMYVYDSIALNISQKIYNIKILEKNSLMNKDNIQHNSNPIIILQKQDNDYILIKENNQLIFDFNDNCPADGYGRIVAKNGYFTIEQTFCSDFNFVNSYATFKINENTNEINLYKYSQEYTDRENTDKDIQTKIWTSKDFGDVKFEDVSEDFIINLIQNNPKK